MSRLTLVIAITLAIFPSTQQGSPPSVIGSHKFVSLEGHFSVSLPAQPNGFSRLTIPTPFGKANGDLHRWQMKEATFGVGYADAAQALDSPETAKEVFNSLRDALNKVAAANSGTAAEVKQISIDKFPGIEQRLDLVTGSIIQRTYLVSRRIYQMIAVVKDSQQVYESVATGVLDTFKILSDAEVAVAKAEKAAKAEPSPLPQAPVALRVNSDAADKGLRGPVKSVLTGSSLEIYNEQGNMVREELYDGRGNLAGITVFGYIDGRRVSTSKWITHEYDPPPLVAVGPAPRSEMKKSDSRYHNRFEFKYDNKKRLIEKTYFHNNGDLWLREVYKYTDKQREELAYSADGSLSQCYLYTLDDKGNEVEKTIFEMRDGSVSSRISFVYEFDSRGNWIKRTASEIVTKDGREERKPQKVYHRTITYY